MAWSGGVFSRQGTVHSGTTLWRDEARDGDATITSSEHDVTDNDLAAGINACINKDGSNAFTGDADLGNNKITNLAEPTATGEGARWDEQVASLAVSGTDLEVNMNDGGQLTVDLAGIASAGEMTLSGDQTVTGKKTFTATGTPISHIRGTGTVYHKVNVLTAAASVTVDTTVNSRFFINNTRPMAITFTIPAASADTDLGTDFTTSGVIMFRNGSGSGAITLSATATDIEEIGSRPTGAGTIYSLVYQVLVTGSTRYVQFTWVTV